MSNIKLNSGSLKFRGGSATMVPDIPIVETMELTYQINSDSQWIFNLNGITPLVKQLLDDGRTMQIQLIRNRGHQSMAKKSPSTYSKIRYPAYLYVPGSQFVGNVPEERKARLSINSFKNSRFTNMNLTSWVNNMIYYSSLTLLTPYRMDVIRDFFQQNGFWFTRFKFCILIGDGFNNYRIAETSDINTGDGWFYLYFFNNRQPININYGPLSGSLSVLAI